MFEQEKYQRFHLIPLFRLIQQPSLWVACKPVAREFLPMDIFFNPLVVNATTS